MVIYAKNQQVPATEARLSRTTARPRTTWLRHCAVILVASLTVQPSLTWSAEQTSNQRQTQIANKVGVLKVANGASQCTAFCVSESLIATAGHCILDGDANARSIATELSFHLQQARLTPPNADPNGGNHLRRSSSIHARVAGGTRISLRKPIEAEQDWAVLQLATPICRQGGLAFATAEELANARHDAKTRTSIARFSLRGDGSHEATWQPCATRTNPLANTDHTYRQDFLKPEGLLFHSCDGGAFASGAPLVVATHTGPKVLAMHVGTYVRSRVFQQNNAVLHRLSSRTIANIAVRAAEFSDVVLLSTGRAVQKRNPNR